MNYEFNFVEVICLLGRPVTMYPNLAHALGNDPGCALFLSNFYYWEGKQEDKEGWIYKSQAAIYKETGLTRPMQERVRKKLRELGILEEHTKATPPTLHFLFNWDKVNEVLDKHFKGVKVDKEKPEESILYKMKVAFDDFFLANVQLAYEWPKGKKGGKDWGGLHNLADTLRRRLQDRKKLSGQEEVQITDIEILDNFKMFLTSLPKYHVARNLTPHLLYANFNKIILDIKNAKPTNNQPTSAPHDYV